jgi:murein DD-endopeptidase MepM/ murein hydrolase activator NlpD
MTWTWRLLAAAALLLGLLLLVLHPTAQALVHWAAPATDLVVPVVGVEPESLRSSWGESRSGLRLHRGIDILARRGTPVIAAAPGQVVRVGQDRLGGNVVWIAGAGARLYYYAHLERFAPGLHSGLVVEAGTELGRVGSTGNARGGPPHLHFGIYPAGNIFRAIDPAPLLRTYGRTMAAHRAPLPAAR